MPGITVALIGTGLFNPSVSAVALNSVPADQSGLAAGINDTFRQAGIAIGVAALGAMIPTGELLSGGSASDYVDGMQTALLAGAGLALAGAIAGALLISRRTANARARADGPSSHCTSSTATAIGPSFASRDRAAWVARPTSTGLPGSGPTVRDNAALRPRACAAVTFGRTSPATGRRRSPSPA